MNTRFSRVCRFVIPFTITVEILCAQPRVLSTTIALADWDLTSPIDIRFGFLNVFHSPASDRLSVSILRSEKNVPHRMTVPIIRPELRPPRGNRGTSTFSRATWIWNTDSLLFNAAEEKRVLSTITSGHFDQVFLQLPRGFVDDTSHDGFLRTVVTNIRERGASVFALSGGPKLSLARNHPLVERLIQRVVDFNAGSPVEARFIGVHFDIEPYLLPGFGSSRKNSILLQYLTLIDCAEQNVHSHGLLLGIDLPFWYDAPDEFTGSVDSIEFNGEKKTVGAFVIDRADEVCIMSYRTAARGTNGILAVSRGTLEYADKQRRKVLIALETGDMPDEEDFTIRGTPAGDTTMLGASDRVVLMTTDRDSAHVFLAPRAQAIATSHTRPNERNSSGGIFFWEVTTSSHISSTTLSFARLGRKQLDETIDVVMDGLSGYSSFGGIAIHHAASYARLPE